MGASVGLALGAAVGLAVGLRVGTFVAQEQSRPKELHIARVMFDCMHLVHLMEREESQDSGEGEGSGSGSGAGAGGVVGEAVGLAVRLHVCPTCARSHPTVQ